MCAMGGKRSFACYAAGVVLADAEMFGEQVIRKNSSDLACAAWTASEALFSIEV